MPNEFLTFLSYPSHLSPSAHPLLPPPAPWLPSFNYSQDLASFFLGSSLLSLVWFVGFLLMFVYLAEDLKRRSFAQFVSQEVGGLGWAEKR